MPCGQQLLVFGEHAEQALDEEVGDLLAVLAAPAHGGGELGELAGGLGGDGGGGLLGAQLFGVGEHPVEQLPGFRLGQLLDADFARLVRVAGEGGVDDDALAVADDEQRRVVELQGVVGELLEGGGEVAAGFLVFPAEVAALPDVGPAVAAARTFWRRARSSNFPGRAAWRRRAGRRGRRNGPAPRRAR